MMSDETQVSGEEIEEMYVQSAGAVEFRESTLTLQGISPAVLFFADRPEREVGHVTWDDFVREWGEGENSFAADPPNAVLTFLEPGDEAPEDVTMVIREPVLAGDSLSYSVEVLDGTPPTSAGPCSLFIDPVGRPLSPGSVAGVHRRQRRRGGRRARRRMR
jgi:hypothetical protein